MNSGPWQAGPCCARRRCLRARPRRGIGRRTQETPPGPGSRPAPSQAADSSSFPPPMEWQRLLPHWPVLFPLGGMFVRCTTLQQNAQHCAGHAEHQPVLKRYAAIISSMAANPPQAHRLPHKFTHGVLLPEEASWASSDVLWNNRNWTSGQEVEQLDLGIDRYLRIKLCGIGVSSFLKLTTAASDRTRRAGQASNGAVAGPRTVGIRPAPLSASYSSRSKIIGLTARARRTGMEAARMPMPSMERTTPTRMTGSFGVA